MRRVVTGGVLAFAVVALGACGEKVNPPLPVQPAPPAAAAGDGGAGPEVKASAEHEASDFVESDHNRDPFRSFLGIFGEPQAKKTFEVQRKVLLDSYGLDELKLVAIVTGADYPRAMVVDPTGKGWVIKRGDYLGRPETMHAGGTGSAEYRVNWRVDRIRDGELVLLREDPAQPNAAPVVRIVTLHPETEGKAGRGDGM